MIDQQSKELIYFTKSELIKSKFADIFKIEETKIGDSLIIQDPKDMDT